MTEYQPLSRRSFCKLGLAGAGAALFAPGSRLRAHQRAPESAEAVVDAPAAPLAFREGSFTLAVLPDTQYYSETWPQHYHNQTQWIADHAEERNIRYVLHLGDITNRNNPPQWEVARAAMKRLDGHVPYALVTGNHDHGPGGDARDRTTMLNDYFDVDDCAKWPTFGGVMEPGQLQNSYHTFEAIGAKFLILALEWGPREATIAWANKIAAQHPQHYKLLVTHAYTYFDDDRYDWQRFGDTQKWSPYSYGTAKQPGGTSDGEALWQKLVRDQSAFVLTVNGHVGGDGLGRLASKARAGNVVHQHLVNYQMHHEGGDGFLRLIEFLPDRRTVQVKAYSPSLDQYRSDDQNQFTLQLDPVLASA